MCWTNGGPSADVIGESLNDRKHTLESRCPLIDPARHIRLPCSFARRRALAANHTRQGIRAARSIRDTCGGPDFGQPSLESRHCGCAENTGEIAGKQGGAVVYASQEDGIHLEDV